MWRKKKEFSTFCLSNGIDAIAISVGIKFIAFNPISIYSSIVFIKPLKLWTHTKKTFQMAFHKMIDTWLISIKISKIESKIFPNSTSNKISRKSQDKAMRVCVRFLFEHVNRIEFFVQLRISAKCSENTYLANAQFVSQLSHRQQWAE